MSRGTKDVRSLIRDSRGRTTSISQMSRGPPKKDAFSVDDAVLLSTLQEKLRLQKEELESRTDTIAAIQRNFESLSSVYMSGKKSVEELHAEIERQSRTINELKLLLAEKDEIEQELLDLRKSDEDHRTMLSELQTEYSLLRRTASRYESENADLQREVKSLRDSQKISDDQRRMIDKMQSQLTEREAKVSELEREIKKGKDDLGDISGKLRSESELRIAESRRANHLDENVQQLTTTRRELVSQQRRLESDNADLRKKLESMELDLASKSKIGEYNAVKMTELERKCAELKAALSKKETLYDALELQNQAKSRQINALEEGIRSLQEKLDEKTSDIDALREEMERLAHDYQSGMSKKTESESQMKMEREASERLLRERRDIMKKNEREIRSLREELKQTKDKLQKLVDRNTKAMEQLTEKNEEFEKMREELLSKKSAFDKLQSEMDQAKSLAARKEEGMESVAQMCQKYESQYMDTLQKLRDTQDELSTLQHDVLRLTNERNELSEQKRALKEKCLKMEMELSEAQEMWEKYEIKTASLEKKLADEVDQKRKLEFRVSELEREIEHVKSIGDEEIEKAANRTKIVADMWEDRCAHQSSEIESLQKQLETLQKERDDALAKQTSAAEKDRIRKLQKRFENTLGKLLKSEEGMESSMMCMNCLELMVEPVVLIPCGHSLCLKCFTELGEGVQCPDCQMHVEAHMKNEILDLVCANATYRKQLLQGLIRECKK